MRIALVSPYSWSYPGGVTRHIEALAEQFMADGHHVRVLSPYDPPDRLAYLWHLRRDRADATEVEIRFTSMDSGGTRIDIEHRGWERLGSAAGQWREQNRSGWETLLPHFQAVIAVTDERSS